MTTYTPGPWNIGHEQGDNPFVFAAQGKKWDNPVICSLYEDVTPECSVTMGEWLKANDNANANARLIAAAPELLGCLIELVSEYEDYTDRDIDFEISQGNQILAQVKRARAAIAKATGGTK